MKIQITHNQEKELDSQNVRHNFTINNEVQFYLTQIDNNLDIPRLSDGTGLYHFTDKDFKSKIVDMIRFDKKSDEFEVDSNQIIPIFQQQEGKTHVEAVGELNCFNVLNVQRVGIFRNKDLQLYLNFKNDENTNYTSDNSKSFQLSSGYIAKTLINKYMMDVIEKKVDMKTVAEQYMILKKTGKSYSGFSPFRDERTPSFHVYPESNRWHDYGASEGGNAITFLQKQHDYTYKQALETLYAWSKNQNFERKFEPLDIEPPKKYGEQALKEVLNLYSKVTDLSERVPSHKAYQYMQSRNFNRETCRDFDLSYVDRFVFPTLYECKGDTLEQLTEAGLVSKTEQGRNFVKLDGRVSIPIHNEKGELVAYNGRQIFENNKQPKYMLTTNSVIFKKSEVLFNFHRAKEYAQKENCLIITEGVFDVMRCHELGLKNSISLLGSAMSDNQLAQVKRLDVPIILALDNDAAGRKATMKISEKLAEANINYIIHEFTDGKDLDEVLQNDVEQSNLKKKIQQFNPKNIEVER